MCEPHIDDILFFFNLRYVLSQFIVGFRQNLSNSGIKLDYSIVFDLTSDSETGTLDADTS